MLQDERFWDDPGAFKPERFLGELKEGQVDPKSLIFGFGRRSATPLPALWFSADSQYSICPGRDMANHLSPAFVMTLLWAFEIAPVEGEARPDPKNPRFVDSAVVYVHVYFVSYATDRFRRCPAPFRCHFRPRSERVVRLISEIPIGA